jgi:hypothetical protein
MVGEDPHPVIAPNHGFEEAAEQSDVLDGAIQAAMLAAKGKPFQDIPYVAALRETGKERNLLVGGSNRSAREDTL